MTDETKKEDKQKPEKAAPPQGGGKGEVLFSPEYTILSKQPIEEYNQGPAKAYAVQDGEGQSGKYFALICTRDMTPRTRIAHSIKNISTPHSVKLVDMRIIWWPETNSQHIALMYERMGNRVMLDDDSMHMDEERAMEKFIIPIADVIEGFRNNDIVHGAIRPSNLYDGGNPEINNLIVGDCMSCPASYNQSAVFEPIERAMAIPSSRGEGTHADDMYAFGATLAAVLRRTNPLKGLSARDIITKKIDLGSYGTIIGTDRITGSVLELLRGLLYDDPTQRWTIDEVKAWIDGRRLSPKQAIKKPVASRPIKFNDQSYIRPQLLAMDFSQNVDEAAKLIESNEFKTWIIRTLDDKLMLERLEKAITTTQEGGQGPNYNELLVNRAAIALDPEAPLRYKDLAVLLNGIGISLTYAIVNKKNIQKFAELITKGIATFWIENQTNSNLDMQALTEKIDSAKVFLKDPKIGQGIERCVYYLNPDAPCLSEKLEGYYVSTPEEMLYAFEDMIATKKMTEGMFLDRHSVSFLSVRDRRTVDVFIGDLDSEDYHEEVLGNLRAFASIQHRNKLAMTPHMAQYFARELQHVYSRFHDSEFVENLKGRVDNLAEKGNLAKIASLFESTGLFRYDYGMFKRGLTEYLYLEAEYKTLQAKMEDVKTYGRETGHEVSAVVSGVLAAITILIVAFSYLAKETF